MTIWPCIVKRLSLLFKSALSLATTTARISAVVNFEMEPSSSLDLLSPGDWHLKYIISWGSSESLEKHKSSVAQPTKAQKLEMFDSRKTASAVRVPSKLRSEIIFDETIAATTSSTTDATSATHSSIRDTYDFVWLTGSNAPCDPSFVTGYTLVITEIDAGIRDHSNQPVLRFEARLTYSLYEAIYTCVPSLENNAYTNFEPIQRSKSMEHLLHDAFKFSTVPGIIDSRGNPMLRFRLNSSAPGKGGEYICTEGWAKIRRVDESDEVEKRDKHVAVDLALLNDAEKDMLYKYDRAEGVYDRL